MKNASASADDTLKEYFEKLNSGGWGSYRAAPKGVSVELQGMRMLISSRVLMTTGGPEFNIDGLEQTLYATRRGDTYVLHFTDATSGHMSYGSGRNVRIPADQSGAVSIDFNYAALLPCSFSRAWNCPIPPMENRLRVPIEAGERFAVDHDGVPLL